MKRLLVFLLVLVSVTGFAVEQRGPYDPGAARKNLSNATDVVSLDLSQRLRAAWAEITGNIYASGSARLEAGTAAAPAYSFASDPDTGIYSPGADSIGFVEGGAEAFRVNNAGEVLIATSTDAGAYKLQVNGLARIQSNAGAPLTLQSNAATGNFYILAADTVGNAYSLGRIGSDDSIYVWNYRNNDVIFGNNSAEKMRMTNGGEVLIATSTDAGDYKLQVNGNARFQGGLTATGMTNEYYIAAGASKTLSEAVGVAKRARLEVTSCVNYYGMADYWIADDFTVTLISQQGSHFANTDTATSICIFNDSGTIRIKNNKASSIYLNINYSGLK